MELMPLTYVLLDRSPVRILDCGVILVYEMVLNELNGQGTLTHTSGCEGGREGEREGETRRGEEGRDRGREERED